MNQTNQKNGFVLLYALLVASVVLVIGLTLSNILLKQLIISSVSREMNQAYYAANAGRDCVHFLYNMQVRFSLPGGLPNELAGLSYQCSGKADEGLAIGNFGADLTLPTDGSSLFLNYDRPGNSADSIVRSCTLFDVGVDNTKPKEFQNAAIRGYNTECRASIGSSLYEPVLGARTVERVVCVNFAGVGGSCTGGD